MSAGYKISFWLCALTSFPTIALGATSELRGLILSQDHSVTRIQLDLSASTAYKFFVLENPRRAVLDLHGARARLSHDLPASFGAVKALRSAPQINGDLRLVIELSEGVSARVTSKAEGSIVVEPIVIEVSAAKTALLTPTEKKHPKIAGVLPVVGISPTTSSSTSNKPSVNIAPSASKPPPLSPVLAAHAPGADKRLLVIAVDAGHGGQDSGAIGRAGTREKDVVLAIAKSLAERINREPGMRSILTRDGDYFLTLRERTRRARSEGADLFVSVHADSVRDPKVSGSSVYVLSDKGATDEQALWLANRENAADMVGGVSLEDKDPEIASVLLDISLSAHISQSMEAAEHVLRSLASVNVVRKLRVQQAGFVVLKNPDIPSMLVETAFISSRLDEQLVRQSDRRDALAEAIFNGVKQYFVEHPPEGTLFSAERRNAKTVIATAKESGIEKISGAL